MDFIIFHAIRAIIICFVMTLYGYLRAFVSLKLGDDGGEVKSRLNLNPAKQLDPIGFILMLVVFVGFVKPMTNNVMNLKNRKRDLILIAILPGILLIAITGIIMYVVNYLTMSRYIVYMGWMVTASLSIFIYNLIPIYPLDGEKILRALATPNFKMKVGEYSNILTMVLMILSFMGIVSKIVLKVVSFMYQFFLM